TIAGFLLLHLHALSLTLPLAILFRVRLFILTHDMAHGAFFPSRRANIWAANVIMPMASYTPASFWRKTHGYHHMFANVLDRDDTPWTTSRYLAAPKQARLFYRVLNHPVAMLSGLVPATVYFIIQQFSPTNHLWEIALEMLVLAFHYHRGSLAFEFASATGGALIGMLLFNVQHSFHGVHRARGESWDNVTNAIFGSSLLVLPWWLAWFTAGLEYHHVHHLNPRVPCYRLQECHEAAKDTLFKHVRRVPWWEMATVLPYSLWDEARGRMVRPNEVV
ncbi:fatty acid desaturase, partial [Catenaria anguillulae PL171]